MKVLNVYLAGNPEDHKVFAQRAKELAHNAAVFGHSVSIVSTWHDNSNVADGLAASRRICQSSAISTEDFMRDPLGAINKPVQLADSDVRAASRLDEAGNECLQGLERADVIIADMNGGGVEAGYAIAKGKYLLTIGDLNSPFPRGIECKIKSYDTWLEVMAHITSPSRRYLYQ